jgi:SAM-dependent methyltransferase
VDETRVRQIVDSWRIVGSPARPDAAQVEVFRSAVHAATRVLILGTTPELIDMLLGTGVDRIAAIERDPDTVEAMRRLATRDWAGVELIAGDWLDPRPAWRSAFDLVLCDGGLIFLPFPDGWRALLAVVGDYLKPGGRFVTRISSVSSSQVGFQAPYTRAIAVFDSERAALAPEEQEHRFIALLAQVRGMCRYGAIDPEGRVRLDVVADARRWMSSDLGTRYPEFEHILRTTYGRPNLAGPDGTSIVAMPSLERVTAELTACGFDVEILASTRRPPRHFFTLSATRISRGDPIP